MNTEARQETADAGCDALAQLYEAQDILGEALAKMRRNALPGAGRVSNAMTQVDRAMDALEDVLRQMGALE